MFRRTFRLAEHFQSSAAHTSPVYHETKKSAFFARRWRNFSQRGIFGKLFTLCGYGAAGLGAYIVSCLAMRTIHQPTVDALFAPGRDYTLNEWRDVEPTLRPGDIILMRGNGLMSWTIATLQFIFSGMHPSALRYSHVAVVVAPAVVEYVDEETYRQAMAAAAPYRVAKLEDALGDPSVGVPSVGEESEKHKTQQQQKQQQPSASVIRASASNDTVRSQLQAEEAALRRRPLVRRSALILEAMDNKGYDIADVTGQVRHDTVQVVEASRRILSTTAANEPAYKYFAVRRLVNYDHTPERQAKMAQFCLDSVGRAMDESLLYPLAFIWQRLHTLTHPLRAAVTGEVSCSELIVELYQCIGVIQRHWRWVRVASTDSETLPTATEGGREGGVSASPTPTAADVAHDRGAGSLHVYDYNYGRVAERGDTEVCSRGRPPLPDAAVIENGDVLASAALRSRSAAAPLQPVWREVERMKEVADFYGRTLQGEAAQAARLKLQRREDATYVRADSAPPALPLSAGELAAGADGAMYQLQWYYKHNSVATCPYQFTEGLGESVLDYAMNVHLGPELHMLIRRPGDGSGWMLEGEDSLL